MCSAPYVNKKKKKMNRMIIDKHTQLDTHISYATSWMKSFNVRATKFMTIVNFLMQKRRGIAVTYNRWTNLVVIWNRKRLGSLAE